MHLCEALWYSNGCEDSGRSMPPDQIIHRMVLLPAVKPNSQLAAKVGNMCLINTTDLERTGNSFVTALLHGMGVLRIKRASC